MICIMVKRIYVEKRSGFDTEALHLKQDLSVNLSLGIERLRLFNRYDIEGISDGDFNAAVQSVFSEPNADQVYYEQLPTLKGAAVFAAEYLPGQFDQRADSAAQCVQLLTQKEAPAVKAARVYALYGSLDDTQIDKIKAYIINPVDSRQADMTKPASLAMDIDYPPDVPVISGFIKYSDEQINDYHKDMGFAMSPQDLAFVRDYFIKEDRDPTLTELKVIDTYWSDHCRHTTFLTRLENIQVEQGELAAPIIKAEALYREIRQSIYAGRSKDISLMDMATIAYKEIKRRGLLDDLDESEEINACSIGVDIMVDGRPERWLVMFKNETHNHPTEIEPFGGAATCLGGAIRDPLSGRSYVYQAMRVTGSADPRTPVEATLPHKLPQRKITTGAAAGYSSYGNQIGLATGVVSEIYDEGYVAKRLEIGAVVGAAPAENVRRERPQEGDVVVLIGGRTGRDGCGGATGSSKAHTKESINTCGAEVQKGNPPTERKLQRLFRNPHCTRLIKRCNDFGAGGVCVAIGELADGLTVNLDAVPKKYEGLDGTELAISESQERMAVVVAEQDAKRLIALAAEENLEATVVARITAEPKLRMLWRGKTIVNIERSFLNTNGVTQTADVRICAPEKSKSPFISGELSGSFSELLTDTLSDLNVASQKGLAERFDSTIGRGTVLMPYAGINQLTPVRTMAGRLPVNGHTDAVTLMSWGYNPTVAKWSPFHGAVYAVIESLAFIAAAGGDISRVRLTLQEYFERLYKNPERWGKPAAALLGAMYCQLQLDIPAIGGKDSMSGSFMDIDVPPTLVSFALAVGDGRKVISPEFKKAGSKIALLRLKRDEYLLPTFKETKAAYIRLAAAIESGKVLSAMPVTYGGAAAAVAKMCFGNAIGAQLEGISKQELFALNLGDIVAELAEGAQLEGAEIIGFTLKEPVIAYNDERVTLKQAEVVWLEPLDGVFKTWADTTGDVPTLSFDNNKAYPRPRVKTARPRVIIPVFPGTNCEYDTAKAFTEAGAVPEIIVVRNASAQDIEQTIERMAKAINNSQIIMLPGGFSGGDEPDGSGKFIATAFRSPRISDAVNELLYKRDGLMLGICNGFQALIKLGLVPYGTIRTIDEACPTLTYNAIGRHVSCISAIRVASNLSPWLRYTQPGQVYNVAISHGEGRFVASEETLKELALQGQIATQYADHNGNAAMDGRYNPNGSCWAVEGITDPSGRIFGKMGHTERYSDGLFKNVPGNYDMPVFRAGVDYFR